MQCVNLDVAKSMNSSDFLKTLYNKNSINQRKKNDWEQRILRFVMLEVLTPSLFYEDVICATYIFIKIGYLYLIGLISLNVITSNLGKILLWTAA